MIPADHPAARAALGASAMLSPSDAPVVIQLQEDSPANRLPIQQGPAAQRNAVGAAVSSALRPGDGLALLLARPPEAHPGATSPSTHPPEPPSGTKGTALTSDTLRRHSVDVAAAYSAPVTPNIDVSLGARLRLDPDRRPDETPSAAGELGVRLRF